MKEENNKDLNISKSTDKSDNNKKSKKSNKDNKNEKINETILNDSKIETTKNSISHSSDSSFQEKSNDSILNDSTYNNKESSASFITKYSSYIKSSFDSKHAYKYSHEEIMSSISISEEIKNLYSNFYSNIEKKLSNIRNEKKIKESVKSKLTPSFWNVQDKESEKLIKNLSKKINALVEEKEALKNSLIFLQSIISKDIEKIKSSIDRSNDFVNSDIENSDIDYIDIDYIDVANKNSDSYDILELLKEAKYKRLISEGDIGKYNSLNNNEQLEFLKYLASSPNSKTFANNLFSSSSNLRIDIFNHFITNDFWIDIYSNEEYQRYAENFYELSKITNDSLPKTPFWGTIILSRNQELNNEEIANIVNNYLQPQLPQIIDNLENIIDSYQNDTSTEISESHINFINNISSHIKEAKIAISSNIEDSSSISIKKIQNFQSSYNNSSNSLYETVENLSTIHPSTNRPYTDENSYEYYSHNITNNRTSSKYEMIHAYSIPSNDYYSRYAQTDADIEQVDKQISANIDSEKPTYEYIQINKRYKIKENKEDKKKEEKNNDSNENPIPVFIKGGIATVTAEFILFIIWSAYFYWHQNSIMAKRIEKITEDLEKLSTIEPTIVIKLPNKIKSIFDTIYEEDEENKEEDYLDTDDKLINLNTPIYHNKTECKLIEPPEILEEIVATPFFITSSSKQINFLIKPDSEHSLIHTKNFNECQNLEASNSYIDAIEI